MKSNMAMKNQHFIGVHLVEYLPDWSLSALLGLAARNVQLPRPPLDSRLCFFVAKKTRGAGGNSEKLVLSVTVKSIEDL